MSSADAFELRGVDAGPVGAPILRGIDLVVPANGVTVLAGPSGAGKSTLLRLLNRLDDPLVGEIRWRDRPLTEWEPTELRRQVAIKFLSGAYALHQVILVRAVVAILVGEGERVESGQPLLRLDPTYAEADDLRIRGQGDFFGARQHGAPELRFADLLEDEDLLIQAQAAARDLVSRDPDLSLPEHGAVKTQLEARYRDRLEMFGVG